MIAASRADCHLLMLTFHAEPEYQAAVESELRAAGVLERVHFVPSVAHADMPELYREADVIVTVPSSDTTPVTLLEAMASGNRIVATDLPSIREWVTPGRGVWLVPAQAPAELATALGEALATSADDRAVFAVENRAVILARASQDGEMGRMEALYRSLGHE
jgi:glycosyltransferase involved in cell wall biosynthesis